MSIHSKLIEKRQLVFKPLLHTFLLPEHSEAEASLAIGQALVVVEDGHV